MYIYNEYILLAYKAKMTCFQSYLKILVILMLCSS